MEAKKKLGILIKRAVMNIKLKLRVVNIAKGKMDIR
jgi:curli biogenesis system outer membrane secretion channel CsgG